jgi:hypothetical protein
LPKTKPISEMKKSVYHIELLLIAACTVYLTASGQIDKDSILTADSDKWKVEQNKGLSGLAKPQFGTYATVDVIKHNAPTVKSKTKESAEFDAEISSEGVDMDISKVKSIEKSKFYKLLLASEANNIEVMFSVASVSKEKRQTFLGKMLSKNDEGKDEVLSYNRDVLGEIATGDDSSHWVFFIDNYSSGSRATAQERAPSASISAGYLKNSWDSLHVQLYSSFDADLVLVDKGGDHVAALKYKWKPAYVWIRKDKVKSYQHAIAAFFSVILAIKDL